MARFLSIMLATVLPAAAGGAAAQTDPAPPRIVAIELHCDANIDRKELLRMLPVAAGDTLAAGTLDQIRTRLMQTELFTDLTIREEPRDAGLALIIQLVRKPIINRVRFLGNRRVRDDPLRRVARLHEGTAYTADAGDHALTRLGERYAAEGFAAARIVLTVRPLAPAEVDVEFLIDEGPPLRIDAVEIAGDLPLSVEDVRDTIDIEPGDRYTRDRQRRGQAAIIQLFRSRDYYDVRVHASWTPTQEYSGVLRFAIQAGPRFTVEFAGNERIANRKILNLMDLSTRPVITDGTWRELGRRAQRAYAEAGYCFATVSVYIDPGPPKTVRFTTAEGVRCRITAVRFEGNRRLASKLLLAQMGTRPPSWIPRRRGVFLPDVLEEDRRRLVRFYRAQGFQSAEVTDTTVARDPDSGDVVVTIALTEGPRTVVRTVLREGMDVLDDEPPPLHLAPGVPFDRHAFRRDRRTLLAALGRRGYLHATVSASVDTEPDGDQLAATVRYVAAPGAQHRVGAIVVQSNFDTRAGVIRREIPLQPGDPLDPDALLQGQNNIYRLGLFRSVTVRPLGEVDEDSDEEEAPAAAPETDDGGSVTDVAVSVSEKPPGTFQWGAGYNTRDGIRGFGEIGHSNLQGKARRLSLRGEFNFDPSEARPDQYIANLGLREPRALNTPWTFRANLLAQRSTRSVDQFSVERFAFIPVVERTFLPGLQAGLEAQAEQAQVFDVEDDVLAFNPRDAGRLRTMSFGPFMVYDRRDDAFVPTRGRFDSLRVKYAPGWLGSDVPFIKLIGQHTQYIPVHEYLTFVYALRGGWANAYTGGDEVPIRERFFLGGRTTVRGFGENDIGPEGSEGHPLGGDLVINTNTELRFPLVYGFGGIVFADGGGVYLQDRAISMHDFRRSSGLGLRYITPVGSISLEYGFKLDRRSDESIGELHFSIGNIF